VHTHTTPASGASKGGGGGVCAFANGTLLRFHVQLDSCSLRQQGWGDGVIAMLLGSKTWHLGNGCGKPTFSAVLPSAGQQDAACSCRWECIQVVDWWRAKHVKGWDGVAGCGGGVGWRGGGCKLAPYNQPKNLPGLPDVEAALRLMHCVPCMLIREGEQLRGAKNALELVRHEVPLSTPC